ncbi:MAG: hypothetical protein ACLFMW_08665 [Ectothiorhodospira sp.]
MNLRALPLLLSCALATLPLQAETIFLQEGEQWRRGDVQVWCGRPQGGSKQPVVLTECQHWDDFRDECLFQRRIHRAGDLKCVEECQHWDDFSSTCHFETRCEHRPEQGGFVRTECRRFDDFRKTCRDTREEWIGP